MSTFEPDNGIRGADDLAILFLSDARQKKLQNEHYRDVVKHMIGGTYEYVMARTRYFDALFTDALNNEIEQIVILGAGYDTRAYRFRDKLMRTSVFEVDAPFTQTVKLEKLKKAGIPHGHVRFVAVDFEKEDLKERLSAGGYKNDVKALFIWEGVSLYLTPGAVDSTLDHLRSLCCAGSVLCFDYFNSHPDSFRKIIKKDELIHFGMYSAEMDEYLCDKGFSAIEEIGPDELQRRFLVCSDGSPFGTTKNKMNIVRSIRGV